MWCGLPSPPPTCWREGRLLEGRPLLSQRWRWFVCAALRAGRGGGLGRLVQFVIDALSPIIRSIAIDTFPLTAPYLRREGRLLEGRPLLSQRWQ
jgi:hypothetical protein